MRKDIAEQWVKALRSGEYEQGMGFLKAYKGPKEQFCCLGVLCEISKLSNWETVRNEYDEPIDQAYLGSVGGLTRLVLDWSEMTSGPAGTVNDADTKTDNPTIREMFEDYDGIISLAAMNDTGVTFEEIADFIEENYEVL